jgi:hypothetical protein
VDGTRVHYADDHHASAAAGDGITREVIMAASEPERAVTVVEQVASMSHTAGTASSGHELPIVHKLDSVVIALINAEPFESEHSLERLVADALRD